MNTPGDLRSSPAETRGTSEKQVRRMKQAEKERRTLLGQSVYLGTLGVMFVLPVVAGAYLGQWLDSLSKGYEVHWTVEHDHSGSRRGWDQCLFFCPGVTDGESQHICDCAV